MKLITWNLNGLASAMKTDAFRQLVSYDADILCFQEIRTQAEDIIMDGYYHFWNHAKRNGYSGTVTLSKTPPQFVRLGFDEEEDVEGRVITFDSKDFLLVNTYAPNSQKNLERHHYRLEWDEKYREYVSTLAEDVPVVLCGDFNAILSELDIYVENERIKKENFDYITDESSNLQILLESGFVDVFREMYPEERSYTWWSQRRQKRRENRGWRLDYFFATENLMDRIIDIRHLTEITGSDHCPVLLEVE